MTPTVSYTDHRHSCHAPCQDMPENIESPVGSGSWIVNPDYVEAEHSDSCLRRVEEPMSSGNWVESGYCVGEASEPEMVNTNDARHSCRAGCSHDIWDGSIRVSAGNWDSCQAACDEVGSEQAPDRVYGAVSGHNWCSAPPMSIEDQTQPGTWIDNPDFIQCSNNTDSAATWLAADAAAVCAARPGCALKPGPTIDDSNGPECRAACSPPEIIDVCNCARQERNRSINRRHVDTAD